MRRWPRASTIAERETYTEPNVVPDDRGRKLVAANRDRHPPSYPTNRDARAPLAATEPVNRLAKARLEFE